MSMENVPIESNDRKVGGGTIATVGGLGVLVAFMVQNTQDVNVEFLFWDFTWPLWLIVLASSTLGALVMIGVGIVRRHRRRKERRAERRD
jgi:uncharacterized integral membrane protein